MPTIKQLVPNLEKHIKDLSKDGWDGFEAKGIPISNLATMEYIIRRLPEDLKCPTFIENEHNIFILEWNDEKNKAQVLINNGDHCCIMEIKDEYKETIPELNNKFIYFLKTFF